LKTEPSGVTYKIIACILLIAGIAGGGWIWQGYQQAWDTPAVTGGPILMEINKGDSFKQITAKLLAQKLNFKPSWFKIVAIRKNAVKKLKTGEYELTPGMTLPEIILMFEQGKTKQYSITFPEGWNFKEIMQALEDNPNLEHTLRGVDFKSLMSQLGADINHPEGVFFPDTYFFGKHASDADLLKRAYDKMQRVLRQEWLGKAETVPFKTPYEALIMASIVEKETGVAAERPLIAGVFIRRLQTGMLLQTDPTVIYGMGENYQGNIGYQDLRTATPYNTYVIKGLPPTPIAMPGRDAIYAALHPDKGDTLYFVARGDGTHAFSATLKDHNLAVNQFQRKKK
jgi:UPF0755 protein